MYVIVFIYLFLTCPELKHETNLRQQQFELDISSVKDNNGFISAKLRDSDSKNLNLNIAVNSGGSIRVKISEDEKRWQVYHFLKLNDSR
jgi:hypothetical protein